MSVTADKVVVELEARLGQYEANVARAETKFDKAMSGIQRSAGATEKIVARAAGAMGAALAGVSAIALARTFLTIADEAKKLDAQLRLATAGFGTFAQAQKDVQRIADETRSGLSETASLYANFTRGAKELGATQADASRATETFSKTLKISGADTNQAASATLQFGQALAAGALRGDELNSILEASPRLARLLAESMGKPIGEIKKLGEEGLLTSDKLLAALTDVKFTNGIDAEFRQIPITFDEAMTRVQNAAITTFGAFDRGGEFSTALANFISDGTDGFQGLADSAEETGIEVRATFEGLSDAFEPLLAGALSAFGQIETQANYTRESIANILAGIDNLRNFLPNLQQAANDFDRKVFGRQFGPDAAPRSNLSGDFTNGFDAAMSRGRNNATDRKMQAFLGGYDVLGNPIAGTPAAGRGSATSVAAGGKPKAKPKGRSGPSAEDIEARFNDQLVSLAQQTISARQRLVTNAEERAEFEFRSVELARNSVLSDINANKQYSDTQKERLRKQVEVLAEAERAGIERERLVQADRDALDIKLGLIRNDQDLLRAQSDISTTRTQRRDMELRLLDLAYQMEKAELDGIVASKDASDAQKKVAQARLDSLGGIYGAQRQGVERNNASPLEAYARNLRETDTQDRVQSYIVDELNAVQDGIAGALQKAIGTDDPLINGLLNLFIEQVIMRPLAEALSGATKGAGGGGLGLVASALGSVFGFASGGSMQIGGRGGTDTNTLSLNGRPIANVSRGETLNVGSKALRGGGGGATIIQNISVDGRNSVTPEGFAQQILSISGQQAQQAAVAMGKGVLKATPVRLASYQRDGT